MTLTNNTFIGEYSFSLDNKGRVNVPSKFRKSLSGDNNNTFVITKGMDPCIYAYPLIQWKKIESDLRELSSLSKLNRSFIRDTARYASPSTYDKQGRITLTPSLIAYAGLDKEILIIGLVNKLEIWDPKQLENTDKQSKNIDPSEFDTLSDKINL